MNSSRASLLELRETNNSLLTTKQNELMKTFTIMAFLMLPLSLIAGVFGMNAEHMPIIGNAFDFWIVLGCMLAVVVVFFAFFKYKRWL
jgi:magnesium transporter